MIFASFCSLTKRHLHCSDHTEKKTSAEWPTDCTLTRQPRRKTSRQSACVHNQRSVTDGSSWRVTSGRNYVTFDTCWSRSRRYWGILGLIVTWCCYNSSCLPNVRSQASSSSLAGQCPGIHTAFEAMNLFSIILPNVERFLPRDAVMLARSWES